jgi:hypothetical protein
VSFEAWRGEGEHKTDLIFTTLSTIGTLNVHHHDRSFVGLAHPDT